MGISHLGNAFYIGNVKHGIGWGFGPNKFGVFIDKIT